MCRLKPELRTNRDMNPEGWQQVGQLYCSALDSGAGQRTAVRSPLGMLNRKDAKSAKKNYDRHWLTPTPTACYAQLTPGAEYP